MQRALNELEFSPKRIAKDVRKALYSAISNAENNHSLDIDSLVVAEAYRRQEPGDEAFLRPRARPLLAHREAVLRDHHRGPRTGRGRLMGQKVNPIGLRLGINRTWDSPLVRQRQGHTRGCCTTTSRVRRELKKRLGQAGVSRIIIERPHKQCRVTIYAARPGVIIGKKGADIDKLRKDLAAMTEGEVHLNIVEVRKPETDAQLVAENIAQQLERRVAFRRAMKRSMQIGHAPGRQGRARSRSPAVLAGPRSPAWSRYHEGRVPRHTLRADIDYGFAEAKTTYGIIGVKAWMFKGEVLEHDPMAQDKRLASESGPAGEGGGRERAAIGASRAARAATAATEATRKDRRHAVAEEDQVPQAVQGPHPRHDQGRLRR